jgi:Lon protease-like protein
MIDLTGRHRATIAAMRLFRYDHLPVELQHVSALFAALAETLIGMLPDDQLLTTALNELWDAKNRAVMLSVLSMENMENK